MEIILAKSAGFCFGVARAVKLTEQAAAEKRNVKTLGSLIHNDSVTERLRELGVSRVDDISGVSSGDTVIIRSHGATADEVFRLEELDIEVIDATCPDVAKIHGIVTEESKDGRFVVIIGDGAHPEVRAIKSRCDNAAVFISVNELEKYFEENPEIRETPVSVVAQTTLSRQIFELCVNYIKKECTNCKIFDTI